MEFTLEIHRRSHRTGRFCFDSCLPLGSAQHQKIVVIDDALAFFGGLDLTIRRWDTSEHPADDPFRVIPRASLTRHFMTSSAWSRARPQR